MSHHFIRFSEVSYKYPDGVEALKNVSFNITHGERVALLGLNGCGKTTLMLHTNGLLLPSTGEVNIGDIPITKKTLSIVRQTVGMVFQNPDDMLFMPTVMDDIAFGPLNMNLPEYEVQRRVQLAISAVGLTPELCSRPAMELSGGQRRAAAVASVLSMEPSILVLDEPSANLDIKARWNLINVLKGFNHTIFLATHDIEMARELCPRAILMSEGHIVADDETERILGDDSILRMAGLR